MEERNCTPDQATGVEFLPVNLGKFLSPWPQFPIFKGRVIVIISRVLPYLFTFNLGGVVCHGALVNIRHLTGVRFLLSCKFWESNSGFQA